MTEVLPAGTRLLHIGPPKTGTSSVQAAFHARRAETIAQGVRYAGSSRHSGSAVLAITGRPAFSRDSGPPPMAKWHALVREVHRARESRVLVSSEFFADAEPPAIRRAVDDMGRESLHVVVTLRPLERIIPSQWQQYVQSNMRLAFDEWLDGTLRNPPGPSPTFWRRHRHDRLVERWAAEVGPERMTVVVIDERDHAHILRVFEGLLGLRVGTLVADEDIVNRSMTWPEVEAVRAFNIAFREAGLGNALFHKVMHFGAAPYMKLRVPPPEEPRIRLPGWAREAVARISREMVDNLRASGVRVLGDLETLVPSPEAGASGPVEEGDAGDAGDARGCISPAIAATMTVGMAVVAGHARGARPLDPPEEAGERAELARYATYQLVGAVLGRARRVVARGVETLTRRGAGSSRRRELPEGATAALRGPDLATARAVEARFAAEGLGSPARQALLRRGLALAAEAVPQGAHDATPEAELHPAPAGTGECVAPPATAWFALSMLEAAGVVRAVEARRPGPLRPVLWPWVEPPQLARLPTLRLLRAVPPRLARAAARRIRG